MQQWDAKSKKVVDPTAHATLVRQLADATRLVTSASMELNAITRNLPGGLPHPDGTESIQNASHALRVAREEWMETHNRLSDYLERGIVLEDLKRSGRKR